MRICVLESSLEGSGLDWLEGLDAVARPDLCTNQHTFEHRFIRKATAKQELDAVVAEGFDFYMNFLWGTPDDPVAGAQASLYFESLAVPSCGVRGEERSMTKNDFYRNAKVRGAPPVPGTEKFPLFVKPANSCASQLIHEKSICYDQEGLDNALETISNALRECRIRRAEEQGIQDGETYAEACARQGRNCEDVVVQEFIPGIDVTCTVLQMGAGCLALTPVVYKTKQTGMKEQFLTAGLKFDKETTFEVLHKSDDASLFERIQKVAIDAFLASGCRKSNMGCDVDLRVRPDGAVFAIEVNPQPAQFMVSGNYPDLPITHSLPGKQAAAINIFITNYLLQSEQLQQVCTKVAGAYDAFSQTYDGTSDNISTVKSSLTKLVEVHDFEGVVFDLGCGTGIFGKVLAAHKSPRSSRVLGFDISPGMLEHCHEYDATYCESFEAALIIYRKFTDTVDHIVSFTAICFLRTEIFTFVLVLCFALANKSITITIDEIPDAFNEALTENGYAHMCMTNHLRAMEAFGEPRGWRLMRYERQFSWTSPKTEHDIYSTCFRFDRVAGEEREMMYEMVEEGAVLNGHASSGSG